MRSTAGVPLRPLIAVAVTGATASVGLLTGTVSARTEVIPGWTARLDRDTAAGTVSAVTWTAAQGAGISADQFALFRISVKLPEGDSVSFPTTQSYSDGTVVRWDQPPLPDGGGPEYPAPALTLSGTATGSDDHHTTAIAGTLLDRRQS